MKIAIITEGYLPELSGVTTSLYNRLKWLSKLGHIVRVYCPDYSQLRNIYPDYENHRGEIFPGITVKPYPSKPYYLKHLRDPKPFSIGYVERDIEVFMPDIIHVECPERLFMGFFCRPGIRISRKHRIPVTAFYHTNYLAYIEDYKKDILMLRIPLIMSLMRKMIEWVYNSYGTTLVPSRITEEYVKSIGLRNIVRNIFYGIDTECFRPKKEVVLPCLQHLKNKIKILYIGRLTNDKQIGLLLDIFDAIREKTGDKCAFIIGGNGTEEENTRAWCDNHSEDSVFVGSIPVSKTPDYYNAADIFVTASPRETFGLTVLEALACGTPVVCPNEGGVVECVQDNISGYLVPSGDVQEFSKAVIRLAENEALRRKMSNAARASAENRSWENAVYNLIHIWEDRIINNYKEMTEYLGTSI